MRKIGRVLIIMVILVLGASLSFAQQTRTTVLMFSIGQEPQIARMPAFAYAGTQPLSKDDQILDAIHYTAKGSNIYEKVIEYHEQTYLKKNWNPAKMRMLVVVRNENKAFTTSGNVSATFSASDSVNKNILGNSKSDNSSLSGSGGIFPSFSKSWTDQKFDVWFFLVE